jgi:hypothetical protein
VESKGRNPEGDPNMVINWFRGAVDGLTSLITDNGLVNHLSAFYLQLLLISFRFSRSRTTEESREECSSNAKAACSY